MEVSQGFSRKIERWLSPSLTYKPFEIDGNPYKARLMIVNSHAAPQLLVEATHKQYLMNALVDEELMHDIFLDYIEQPKEYKGMKKLVKWLRIHCDVEPVISAINTLMVDNAAELKAAARQQKEAFEYGEQVFDEVLEEFTHVDTLLLHGTYAFEQFKQRYASKLTIINEADSSIKDVEEHGLYAQLQLANRVIDVFVCRSLTPFTANNASYTQLRAHLYAHFVEKDEQSKYITV